MSNIQKLDLPLQIVSAKLNFFALLEFEKVVYLDLDTVICESINCFFARPHLSAVTAGAAISENGNWVDLNSGLMVIDPKKGRFAI